MDGIEAVIFDSGGVLHQSDTAMAHDLLHELGITAEMLEQIMSRQMPLLGSGMVDETEFWRQVSAAYNLREVAVEENLLGRAFAKAIVEHLPITELIKNLSAHNIKLAVLSNTIQPHASALTKAGIYDNFDHVFLSHEVGMLKPNPAIYRHTLNELGVRPEAAVFIDDDRTNINAAKSLGIHSILYTNADQVITEVSSLITSSRH